MIPNSNKKRKKLHSARSRLIFLLLLLTAASLIFIWLCQSLFLPKVYLHIKTVEISNGFSELQNAENDTERAEIAQKLSEEGICTLIYRMNSSTGMPVCICNCETKPNCNCLLHRILVQQKRGGFISPFLEENLGSRTVYNTIVSAMDMGGSAMLTEEGATDELAKIVLGKDAEGATVAYFLSTTVVPMDSTVRTLNVMMIYVSMVVVLISILFALGISFWITRPIEKINKSAKQLTSCNYDVKFEGEGYKEIGELAETLNYASSELAKVDNLQKELIANISHDLRTPLTLIAGYAEVMRDIPEEKTEENLQIIIDESNRMKTLVNDVLDISKIRAGTEQMVMTPLQLTNCIESELSRYNKLRDREGYTIDFIYDCLVTVNGDYSRLMQVVYNLVNNAVNYTGEDKRVIVTQTVKDGKARISVTDTGEGIAEEELPLIWERYYKVDKTHKRATVGSGLGLSIVKSVVEAHGGTYGVYSKLGEGSTFWFELDVLSTAPLPDERGED